MKFVAEKNVLLKALSHGQSIVEKKHTMPILSNIKIEAFKNEDGDFIRLVSTNTEIEIVEIIPAVISEIGVTTASADKLYSIVNKLENGSQVEFVSNDGEAKLNIKSGKSIFHIPTIPADTFYIMENADLTTNFKISPINLKMLIDNTSFAVAKDTTTHLSLGGVYLHEINQNDGAMLRAVATDGHRMACQDIPLPSGAEGMNGVIIPKKALDKLDELLNGQIDDIDVSLSSTSIVFNFKNLKFSANLVDGKYPDYLRVIPSNNDKVMEINSQVFGDAIDRISVMADKNNVLKVKICKNMIEISSNSSEGGSSEEPVDAIYVGDTMEIGFNFRYLSEILKKIPGIVKISFSENSKPVLLQGQDVKDSLYVLMPMRV